MPRNETKKWIADQYIGARRLIARGKRGGKTEEFKAWLQEQDWYSGGPDDEPWERIGPDFEDWIKTVQAESQAADERGYTSAEIEEVKAKLREEEPIEPLGVPQGIGLAMQREYGQRLRPMTWIVWRLEAEEREQEEQQEWYLVWLVGKDGHLDMGMCQTAIWDKKWEKWGLPQPMEHLLVTHWAYLPAAPNMDTPWGMEE